MKTTKIITMLALIVSLVGGFTNNVNAQKKDSIVFYKDTMLIYMSVSSGGQPWGVAIGDFNPDLSSHRDYSLPSDTLHIEYDFHKNVTINSITMYIYGVIYDNIDTFTKINGKNYYIPKISNTNFSFDIDSFKTNKLTIRIIGKWFYSMNIRLTNFVVNYTDNNTSFSEVKNDISKIQFINNKFESTTKIDNIKVYDISCKLIQEGTLNDIYQLEKNTLYFVLFDNKYSKKIFTVK